MMRLAQGLLSLFFLLTIQTTVVIAQCSDDEKVCNDGTVLVRDLQYNCNFPPCPDFECGQLNRYVCKKGRYGCMWMFGERKCVMRSQLDCTTLDRKGNCKRTDHCIWQSGQCQAACPKVDDTAAECANQEGNPVTCGTSEENGLLCPYENLCQAQAAGNRAKLCYKVCSTNKDCPNPVKEVCLKQDSTAAGSSGICVFRSRSACGDGKMCPIGKRCVTDYDNGGEVCVSYGCPKPKNKNSCDDNENDAMLCGKTGCTYQNPCFAASAGYKETDCRRL